MAFEPVYETAAFDTFVKLGKGQAVVEARLLPRPETRIAKVLSTSSSVGINSCESFTGEARYAGRVNFKVLFESTDGKVESLDYNADFSDKIEASDVGAGTKTFFTASVLDMDITAAEEDVIKLAAVIEVTLFGSDRENMRYLAKGGETVFTHEERIKCSVLSAAVNDTFIISDTAEIRNDCEILGAEGDVFTTKRIAGDNRLTLGGEAAINVIFRDKSGSCGTQKVKIPIDREFGAEGAIDGDIVTGGMSLKNIALSMHGDEEKTLEIELTAKADCLIFRESEIAPSTDVFCLDREVSQTTQSILPSLPRGDESVEETIEGSISIDENLPLADSVLGAYGSRINVSNVTCIDGRVRVEGMLGSNIVYYSSERGSRNTVFAQIPFSVPLSARLSCDGDLVTATGAVKDVSVKIRRGNELFLGADIVFNVCAVKQQNKVIITEIKLEGKKPESDAAVTVHIARKGETLWDAAKALCLPPEEVARRNEGVPIPCTGGERLIAFRRLERKSRSLD